MKCNVMYSSQYNHKDTMQYLSDNNVKFLVNKIDVQACNIRPTCYMTMRGGISRCHRKKKVKIQKSCRNMYSTPISAMPLLHTRMRQALNKSNKYTLRKQKCVLA